MRGKGERTAKELTILPTSTSNFLPILGTYTVLSCLSGRVSLLFVGVTCTTALTLLDPPFELSLRLDMEGIPLSLLPVVELEARELRRLIVELERDTLRDFESKVDPKAKDRLEVLESTLALGVRVGTGILLDVLRLGVAIEDNGVEGVLGGGVLERVGGYLFEVGILDGVF